MVFVLDSFGDDRSNIEVYCINSSGEILTEHAFIINSYFTVIPKNTSIKND